MKKDEITEARTIPVSVSPAKAPANLPYQQQEEDQDVLSLISDKRYGLHGEILMLVMVIAFSLFLVILVALPYFKRNRDLESGYSDSIQQRNCSFLSLIRKIKRVEDGASSHASGGCLQCSNDINRKFPS